MVRNPEISIIVPVYKVEKYLVECLNSILSQSFKDFELLLVDDGSPDRCPQICDEYGLKDPRVVTFHKKNGGQASARNCGLDHAKGRYLMFVDSDDLLAEDALKHLYREITTTNADVVLGKVIRFDAVSGKLRPYTHLEDYKEMSGRETLEMLLEGHLLNISVWGGVYKRKIWDEVRMPVGHVCEDWYIMPDIYLQKGTVVVFSPTLVYLYRDNGQSTMSVLYRQCNTQVIDVAEHVIQTIKQVDNNLYHTTLWSNIKRVWKYVGIIYSQKRRNDELDFLSKVRTLIKSYWAELISAGKMTTEERIGVWAFCFCEPICRLLYILKYSKVD
jgi:glycosyltransferase involved in cell wall biosynthesis